MNEEYVKAYVAAINAELQTKVLEIISLKAQMQLLKESNRTQEEELIALRETINQVVNTTEETYANTPVPAKATSGKKKAKKE
jgi:hypothetical protein